MITRYTLPEMDALWGEQAKFESWLEVEIEAAHAMAEAKIIPQKAYQSIKKKATFDIKRIDEIEAEVDHDVIAFLTAVSEHVGEDAKYLHYGLTSSDVVDTALALRMKRSAAVIDKKIVETLKQIKRLATKYKTTPCIGRTHGVLAEPTTAGLKFALWYSDLERCRDRFTAATTNISVGKLSGAVGNFANLDPKIERSVCKRLGLTPANISTQVLQRDRHAEFVSALALLASTLEKFTTEIRNLHRPEIGEMSEGFAKKQKGSSAMPHKRNPITCERISGIARLVRGYALTAMENIALWHERDITHSSVERVIIPDATTIVDYALHKFIGVLKNLKINEDRMMRNIYFGGGLVFSQKLLLKLAGPVGSRDTAYRMVQRNALAAAEGHGLFNDLVKKDKDIRAHLSTSEIDACFELKPYLRNVPKIFKRVFKT
ncbi:adenylosuccinate lyase [candidate division GN15 bacterium]|nr:adenylosuccinate lyase [candidate division GN15 bacterium]